ncbi:GGDEF domain-containing protein [Neiella marina]|uniref:diguanylate cyclase n=1 Tax=Neiella holothuriorum TaxID=2870530 RepID=A0ABS7EEV8_9GAMM|nr:GGDEF domain-containing protein [Neiella holothuriorum]MBW8190877.1 GGDEF domain-containing protein [Neiella holothuriorum]
MDTMQMSSSAFDANMDQARAPVFSVYYNERPSSLLSILQTEIELKPLLRLYLEQARQRVSLDGISLFWNNQQFHVGDTSSSYRLTVEWTIDDHEPVKLAYSSRHSFSNHKHQQLDWLQRQLHFPLRNALRYESMRQQARTDHLTNLGNRASFDDHACRYLSQARRSRQHLAIVLLDLDRFKQVNDDYGHLMGDRVLQAAAECLQEAIRGSDIAFRFGGDEYAALLVDCSEEACMLVQKRILEHFQQHPLLKKLGVGVSVGAALSSPADNIESWLARADEAMYAMKRNDASLSA